MKYSQKDIVFIAKRMGRDPDSVRESICHLKRRQGIIHHNVAVIAYANKNNLPTSRLLNSLTQDEKNEWLMHNPATINNVKNITNNNISKAGDSFNIGGDAKNINFAASGASIVQHLNNNTPRELIELLEQVLHIVESSKELNEAQKQNYAADIESLISQLNKPNKNKDMIQMLWDNISKLNNLNGVANLILKITGFLQASKLIP